MWSCSCWSIDRQHFDLKSCFPLNQGIAFRPGKKIKMTAFSFELPDMQALLIKRELGYSPAIVQSGIPTNSASTLSPELEASNTGAVL